MTTARRVTLVANELRGFHPAGGMGTATTHLALALARMGHSVDVLIGWRHAAEDVDPEWGDLYSRAGIRLHSVRDTGERVEPPHFEVARRVELELRADQPDVVIAHDLGGPAYSALRLRQAGIAFEHTVFVVYCHGPRRYIMELSRQLGIKDLRELLDVAVHEQASVELADAVVSPSGYLLDWMRHNGWQLPEQSSVIPYFTRSSALGEDPPRAAPATAGVERLVFFGRLDERKGLRLLADALNALPHELLHGIELEFLGKPSASWPPARVESLLSDATRGALRDLGFETSLDQREALAHLRQPGTLVVLPSLLENSPNTVYECLEQQIPFIASDVGGVPELIAPEDRSRVLFEPTSQGVEQALRTAVTSQAPLLPARASFTSEDIRTRWEEVLHLRPRPRHLRSDGAPSDFVLLVGDGDEPDERLTEVLAKAQAATDADVVTCAAHVTTEQGSTVHFFSGDAGGLGALSNTYGTTALVRASLLDRAMPAAGWPLLAALAARGARIVSVPEPLVAGRTDPAVTDAAQTDALLAVDQLEAALPGPMRALARLAAGLAPADAEQRSGPPSPVRRALRRLRRARSAA